MSIMSCLTRKLDKYAPAKNQRIAQGRKRKMKELIDLGDKINERQGGALQRLMKLLTRAKAKGRSR